MSIDTGVQIVSGTDAPSSGMLAVGISGEIRAVVSIILCREAKNAMAEC